MPRTKIIPPTDRGVKTEEVLPVAELFAGLEGPVLLWIQEDLRGPLDELISGYTQLGNIGLLWLVLSAAMLLWRPTRKAGAAALLAMLLGEILFLIAAFLGEKYGCIREGRIRQEKMSKGKKL